MDDRDDDPPCNAVVELLTAYLDGALTAHDRGLIDRHLGECPYCETYLDQLRFAVLVAGTLRREDVPPPLMDVLVAAFRAGEHAP